MDEEWICICKSILSPSLGYGLLTTHTIILLTHYYTNKHHDPNLLCQTRAEIKWEQIMWIPSEDCEVHNTVILNKSSMVYHIMEGQ